VVKKGFVGNVWITGAACFSYVSLGKGLYRLSIKSVRTTRFKGVKKTI
jgi:hypothetical protein